MAATTVGTSVQTALTTSIAAAGTAASATALTAGTTMIQSLVSGITGMTPTAVSTANSTGLKTVQGLALGILAGTSTAVSAAQTVVNAVTATFSSINLHSAGYNAAAGFASGLASCWCDLRTGPGDRVYCTFYYTVGVTNSFTFQGNDENRTVYRRRYGYRY